MMTLKGFIIDQTNKAIQFEVCEDLLLHLRNQRHWFPTSKVKITKSRDNFDVIRMPDWLYDSRVKIPVGSE